MVGHCQLLAYVSVCVETFGKQAHVATYALTTLLPPFCNAHGSLWAAEEMSSNLVAELAAAGVACSVADGLFHPLDTLKTRLQASPRLGRQNLIDLWTSGLAATAARALTFAATRVGAYPTVRDAMSSGADASVSVRVAAGSLTGALAAAAFTPLDILRLRSQLMPRAHPALDVLGGLRKLAASEGFSALWRGASVNVARASVLTAAQLASYDGVKRHLRDERGWREDDSLHVTAALTAGAIAQTFVQPLCAARTRIFVGQRPASGPFWRGYAAGLARQGPVLAVTLTLTERARAALGLSPM